MLLRTAIETLEQPPLLDLSDCVLEGGRDIALTNLYYAVLADAPALKYAYDMEIQVTAEGAVRCLFSYMPYRLGSEDIQGAQVSTLADLVKVGRAGVGEEVVPICITDPSLDVDDMSRALQQVGDGYILCSLSEDATALLYAPAMGYTMEECLDLREQALSDAAALVAELTTADMGEKERLTVLYTWLTDQVRYDQRYYSDRSSLPFTATTPTGAFRDKLAICGGYAQALKLLCEAAELEVYTVSGRAAGDYHMWDIVRIDGDWLYCDPTFDRNTSRFGFRHFLVADSGIADDHQWDPDFLTRLIGS